MLSQGGTRPESAAAPVDHVALLRDLPFVRNRYREAAVGLKDVSDSGGVYERVWLVLADIDCGAVFGLNGEHKEATFLFYS